MTSQETKTTFPWLDSVKTDPIPVLLKAAPLHIRFQVYRDILEDSESDTSQAFRKNLRTQKERRTLLNSQNELGQWPLSGKTSGFKRSQLDTLQFLRQIEVLNELLVLQVTSKQEKALLGMREVIRYLDNPHEQIRLHQLIHAIYLSIRFELDSNPIIKNLTWDILKQQKADGGWSSLPGEESCIWTSLFFLWTMGHSAQFAKNRTLSKGLKYVEENLLNAKSSTLLPGMQAWDTLLSGGSGLSVLHGGTLRFLETVQLLQPDFHDRKIDKLVDWLLSVQLKNSLWPSIVGRDKQGNYDVTLRVLRVVKHFQSLRISDTENYDD